MQESDPSSVAFAHRLNGPLAWAQTVALMSGVRGPRRNWFVLAFVALVAAAVVAPTGLGFSTGITSDNAGVGDFEAFGCTACHGEQHKFQPLDNTAITFRVVGADGAPVNGPYTKEATYTIAIALAEANAPTEANHAGFNLRASGGTLSAVEGQSKVAGDGTQATHVGPGRTSWNVTWKAPASGAVSFRLFVNDVDGDGSPSKTDQVRQAFFGLTDEAGAALGAPEEPKEVLYGISLQQYWIGLIALAGMLFIMLAGYVYLKYGSPHNTDAKDR
ncbi:MAG: hypothetical protein QOD77_2088 [Thermoplasmata archaeon]|jgi:hypothetical protein|nr:hypothetical protein [Thermoplasmata archaeon]